jgi:hypothetical protein
MSPDLNPIKFVERSENSSGEKAPFKSGRTGAVYTRGLGPTASTEVQKLIDGYTKRLIAVILAKGYALKYQV